MIRFATLAVAIAGLICVSSGCSVWQQARRTTLHEPLAYPWKLDRQRSLKAYRSWAEQAWQNESGTCPDGPPSDHYELGFKDGFVDFVYAGGDGQPPPIPPRQFWNLAWRSPQGHSAADEWFAGYRHGAKAARAGGYRNLGVVYSSLRSGGHLNTSDPMLLGPPQAISEDVGPPGEILPPPTPTAAPVVEPAAPLEHPPTQEPKAPAGAEAPRAAATPDAPVLGAPVENHRDVDAAMPRREQAPPTPPAIPSTPATTEPSPFDEPPASTPQGAAMIFRRAISTATNGAQPGAHPPAMPAWLPPATAPAVSGSVSSSATADSGPPAWPNPAMGAGKVGFTDVAPASFGGDAALSPPQRNILRQPKQ